MSSELELDVCRSGGWRHTSTLLRFIPTYLPTFCPADFTTAVELLYVKLLRISLHNDDDDDDDDDRLDTPVK